MIQVANITSAILSSGILLSFHVEIHGNFSPGHVLIGTSSHLFEHVDYAFAVCEVRRVILQITAYLPNYSFMKQHIGDVCRLPSALLLFAAS